MLKQIQKANHQKMNKVYVSHCLVSNAGFLLFGSAYRAHKNLEAFLTDPDPAFFFF